MLGYYLHKNRGKKISVSRLVSTTMWISSAALLLFLAYTTGVLHAPGADFHPITNAMFFGFIYVGWTLPFVWIIFTIQNGNGGIVKKFLELPMWRPLGRMGLSVYLISFVFQNFIIVSSKQRYYFTEFDMLHHFLGDVLVSMLLGTIGYLAFEVPFLAVENYFYKKFTTKTE
jgi:hypothetical protein